MEDRAIVALYLKRDEDAIAESALKYGARLRSISQGIVEDAPTAEECENDTYFEAWRRIPPHDPSEYLFAFLARIIRNLSIDALRRQNRLKRRADVVQLSAEMEACIPSPDDTAARVEALELGKAVGRYLATLSEEKRVLFVRRYWYLDSVPSIAERMNMGQSRVKMTLFRVRAGLREFLRKEGYDL